MRVGGVSFLRLITIIIWARLAFQLFFCELRSFNALFIDMELPTNECWCDDSHFDGHEDSKDQIKTPRDISDQWRFTSSLLDTNSFTFSAFVNPPSGYYTPTPGGTSTAYHNQAGDLHTPSMGFHVGTPLSMPTSEGHVHPTAAVDMHGFNPQILDPNHYHTPTVFAPSQSYAPSTFLQDAGFDAIDPSRDDCAAQEMNLKSESKGEINFMSFPQRTFATDMPAPPIPSLEK